MEKKRRRFGDRKEGRKLRSLSPMAKVSPYIMKTRNSSQNFIRDSVNVGGIDGFIRHKRKEGCEGMGIMHVLIAAYIRAVSQLPGINRFIGGQKIFARDNIEVVFVIKKEMTLESMDTVIKLEFEPTATVTEVYQAITSAIQNYREGEGSGFDGTAKILNFIPGLLMKFTVWLLNFLDYFGWLPKKLLKVSPFHGSFFITSMGSLGIPPIYHHLYDFGNVPVFCSFGAVQKRYEPRADGTRRTVRYLDYTFVTDERICDGFYFASALKLIRRLLKNPSLLDTPPAAVIADVD